MELNKLVLVLMVAVTAPNALFSVQGFSYVTVDLGKPCPTIQAIANLEMMPLCGWWYHAYSTLENTFCYHDNGHTIFAAPFNATTLNFVACCRSVTSPAIPACGEDIGTGYVLPGANIGEFIWKYGRTKEYSLYSLGMEYDKYDIAYGCYPENGKRVETLVVVSRDYELSPSSLSSVRGILNQNGVNLSIAKKIKQGPSIPYVPNIQQCKRG